MSIDQLSQATAGTAATADLAAVLIKESAQGGLSQVLLVSGGMSVVRARLETNPFPSKGDPRVVHGAKRAREHWFEQTLQAVRRHVDFERVRCVVLAGPGFTKDDFLQYMLAQAARREWRDLLGSRSKWVLAHASTAYKHALRELFADPAVVARVSDTRAAAEVHALAEFLKRMASEPERVTYGLRQVRYALSQGALDRLLLADTLLRARTVQERARYVALVDEAKAGGATVHVFSDLHASGEQLANLGGIAALLRFPLPVDDMLAEQLAAQDAVGAEPKGREAQDAEAAPQQDAATALGEELWVYSTPPGPPERTLPLVDF